MRGILFPVLLSTCVLPERSRLLQLASHERQVIVDERPHRSTARPDRSESGFPRGSEGASLTH